MADLKITSLTVGELAVNCWFLVNEETKEALVFDPGDEAWKIEAFAVSNGWKIRAILLTHGHTDHIGGADELRKRTGAKIYALEEEETTLLDGKKNLSVFMNQKLIQVEADIFLKDGQSLTLAGITLQVLHTPGHTSGGTSYYCREAESVFSGDTLFRESVGRSDFPGGSMSALVRSVKEKLFSLPDETRVLPGHGEETSIGYEKLYNPYLG
jgi:glyoxylase-like metal-dependent hydrolase (beta-lactamase superfamily II)